MRGMLRHISAVGPATVHNQKHSDHSVIFYAIDHTPVTNTVSPLPSKRSL